MTKLCPNCGLETDTLKSVISKGELISGCDGCLHTQIQGIEGSAKHFREYQKKQFRKEITQPNQGRDFIRAYGVDKAREYMNDETIRRLS